MSPPLCDIPSGCCSFTVMSPPLPVLSTVVPASHALALQLTTFCEPAVRVPSHFGVFKNTRSVFATGLHIGVS